MEVSIKRNNNNRWTSQTRINCGAGNSADSSEDSSSTASSSNGGASVDTTSGKEIEDSLKILDAFRVNKQLNKYRSSDNMTQTEISVTATTQPAPFRTATGASHTTQALKNAWERQSRIDDSKKRKTLQIKEPEKRMTAKISVSPKLIRKSVEIEPGFDLNQEFESLEITAKPGGGSGKFPKIRARTKSGESTGKWDLPTSIEARSSINDVSLEWNMTNDEKRKKLNEEIIKSEILTGGKYYSYNIKPRETAVNSRNNPNTVDFKIGEATSRPGSSRASSPFRSASPTLLAPRNPSPVAHFHKASAVSENEKAINTTGGSGSRPPSRPESPFRSASPNRLTPRSQSPVQHFNKPTARDRSAARYGHREKKRRCRRQSSKSSTTTAEASTTPGESPSPSLSERPPRPFRSLSPTRLSPRSPINVKHYNIPDEEISGGKRYNLIINFSNI